MAQVPVPSSDQTLQSAPEYIVEGVDWVDPDWIAAARAPQRSEVQNLLWAGGPRPHPWGNAVHVGVLADGRRAFFPSQAAYDAFMQRDKAQQQRAQDVLQRMNEGLQGAGGPAPTPVEAAAKQPPEAAAGQLGPSPLP
jgi:hypothetical protein